MFESLLGEVCLIAVEALATKSDHGAQLEGQLEELRRLEEEKADVETANMEHHENISRKNSVLAGAYEARFSNRMSSSSNQSLDEFVRITLIHR